MTEIAMMCVVAKYGAGVSKTTSNFSIIIQKQHATMVFITFKLIKLYREATFFPQK